MKNNHNYAYMVLVSAGTILAGGLIMVANGEVHPVGSFIMLLGAALSLLTGVVLAVKEIKVMRSDNQKRLSIFFITSYIASVVIALCGYFFILYISSSYSTYDGWDALGFLILGVFIIASGVFFNVVLSVSLAIRRIKNDKGRSASITSP
ncbi:MAG: hypothetical protein FWG88_05485 [Oscillospiraceae bacterium]|nr:hypothetical protein [Oscillospiraceae bacterium]